MVDFKSSFTPKGWPECFQFFEMHGLISVDCADRSHLFRQDGNTFARFLETFAVGVGKFQETQLSEYNFPSPFLASVSFLEEIPIADVFGIKDCCFNS